MKKAFGLLAAAVSLFGFGTTVMNAQDYNWDKPDGLISHYDIWITGNGNPRAAIMPIYREDKKPVNCKLEQWGKEEERAFNLYVRVPTKPPLQKDSNGNYVDSKEEWVTATFTFRVRSRKDADVLFRVAPSNNWHREKPGTNHDLYDLPDVGFMGIAEITSKDIKFPNGGVFTSADLSKWGIQTKNIKDKNKRPTVLIDDNLTTPGKKYLRTCNMLSFVFRAKTQKEYTITVKVKPMEWYKALH